MALDLSSAFDPDDSPLVLALDNLAKGIATAGNTLLTALNDLAGKIVNKSPSKPPTEKEGGGAISGAISGVVGAISGAVGAIQGLVDIAKSFVQALNPGVIEQFTRAVADVAATIGTALLPFFQAWIPVLQQIGGELLPAMEALAPIVAQFTTTLGNLTLPIVRIFAATLEALMPIFQIIQDFLQGIVTLLQPVFAILQALIKAFGSLIQTVATSLAPLMVKFAAAVQEAVFQLIKFVVMLAKSFGADQFVQDFLDSLNPQKKVGATASGNVSLQNLDSISKQMQQLSFAAAGSNKPADPLVSLSEKQLEELKKISGNETIKDLVQAIKDLTEWLRRRYDNNIPSVTINRIGNTLQGNTDQGVAPETRRSIRNFLGLD